MKVYPGSSVNKNERYALVDALKAFIASSTKPFPSGTCYYCAAGVTVEHRNGCVVGTATKLMMELEAYKPGDDGHEIDKVFNVTSP